MNWVKIDNNFFSNPKVVGLSKDAKLVYLAGICYAGSSLSDGFIPQPVVTILSAQCQVRRIQPVTKELVEMGLWLTTCCHKQDGFQIHEYLDYNTSSAEVQAKRESARTRMADLRSNRSQNVRANIEESSRELRSTDIETETERESTKPAPSTPTPITQALTERFNRFWDAYPKKADKHKASVVWFKIKPDEDMLTTMLESLAIWRESKQWQDERGKFVPHATTWLNNKRWEDELPTALSNPFSGMTENEQMLREAGLQ